MSSDAPVALVSGAGGGIGSAVVHRLAEAGWQVAACDVAWPIDSFEGVSLVHTVETDVRDAASVDQAVAEAVALGPLRAVVNVAGVLLATPIETFSDADVSRMWEVNVAGTARLCRAAINESSDLDAIVNIGAIAGNLGRLVGNSLYSATKMGIESLTRSLAYELAPRGIRVNAVSPGFIDVPMSESMRKISGGKEASLEHIPLGRMGTTSEIAEVVEFLLSQRASYIDGTVIVVDGGVCAA